jgi:hypothetical protein
MMGLAAGAVSAELWVRVGSGFLLFGAGVVLTWIFAERRLPGSTRVWRGLRWPARAAVVLTFMVGVLATTQVVTFGGKPMPPVQIIRGNGLHVLSGAPVWDGTTDRQHRACADEHPERLRILFFGSSITWGSGVQPEEAFTVELERRLNAAFPTPGVCVMNFSQAGYSFQQKYAVASVEIPRYRPALVLWEDWNEWFVDYRMLGDSAFDLHGLALSPDGFPFVKGVPAWANRFLYLHSHLYQYLTLSFTPRLPPRNLEETLTEFFNGPFARVPALAASVGARLALYPAPPLNQSFADVVASPPAWHKAFVAFARQRGIPVFPLEDALAGEDFEQLRLDPCCHYNARGHRALVPVFERIVRDILRDRLTRL